MNLSEYMNEEDKRHYKRYKTQYQCKLTVGDESFKGPVIDYSDGLGAIFVYTPHIEQGAVVDIGIPDMEMEFKGEVAWVSRDGDYLNVGIKRIGNLTGNLQYYKLADILIGIHRSAKTGILEIKSGSLVKKVFIKNGDMIFASSNNKDDRLGEILVKEGTISFAEYNKASRILIKTGQKLGKILVDIGALTPKELFEGLRRQIEEVILGLFEIQEGFFEIREEPLPAEELITLQISTANIIYKGIKRLNNFLYVRDMCPSEQDILIQSQNPINIFQAIKLSGYDRAILHHVNGINPLEKILAASPLSDFDTLKTIAALLSIRLISEKGKESDPAKRSIENIFDISEEEAPQDFLEKLEEMFQKCESVGYYDVLGVTRDTAPEEITRAYYRLSRQFHPDRHFSFPGLNIKGKLIKIFSYITEAFEILIDPQRRRQYDEAFHDEYMKKEVPQEPLPEAERSPVEAEPLTEDIPSEDDLVDIADVPPSDQEPAAEGSSPEAEAEAGEEAVVSDEIPAEEALSQAEPVVEERDLPQEPVHDDIIHQEANVTEDMPLPKDEIAEEIYAEEESAFENMSSWQDRDDEEAAPAPESALKEAIEEGEQDDKAETFNDTPAIDLPSFETDDVPAAPAQKERPQFDTDKKLLFTDDAITEPVNEEMKDERPSPEEEKEEYALAAGKHPSRLIRFYLPVMLVLILLIGSSIPLYNKMKGQFSHSGPEVGAIAESLPAFHNDAIRMTAKAPAMHTGSFPSFRDDAFHKIYQE